MVLKITLPPEGLFIRELILSELLSLDNIGLEIKGDEVIINGEEEFKGQLGYELKESKNVLKELLPYRRNYGEVIEMAEKVFNGGIEEFLKDDKEEYFIPLVFPEMMEAERWWGGWSGTSKGGKRTVGATRQALILSLLGFYKYQIYNYFTKDGNFSVLALVDNTIVSDMCRPSVKKEKIRLSKESVKKLSHISRLLIFSTALSEQGCQELLLLKKEQYRAEIYEKNPHASIKPLIRFWALVNDEKVENDFISLANNHPDVFNRVVNYIFDGIRQTLTPAEVIFMIARETYLSHENVTLTSRDMRKIREAIEKIRAEEKTMYY
mgnify:CR=1 FL=1